MCFVSTFLQTKKHTGMVINKFFFSSKVIFSRPIFLDSFFYGRGLQANTFLFSNRSIWD